MYPLTLIRISKGKKIEIETKSGDFYEGILLGCDLLMNLHLKNVLVKLNFNNSFFLNECYLKGSNIKYIKLQNGILDVQKKMEHKIK